MPKWWDFLTTPLLPEWSSDKSLSDLVTGEEEPPGITRRIYQNFLRPTSSPLGLIGWLPYGKATQGLGKMGLARFRGVPKGQRYAAGVGDFNRALYGALLSSPQTTSRAGLGALSGSIVGGLEETFSRRNVKAIPQILKSYATEGPSEFAKGFIGLPSPWGTVSRVPISYEPGIANQALSVPTRLLGGVDRAARNAMMRAGISPERAERLTLAGKPETKLGNMLLGLFEKAPFSQVSIPFARVGIHTLEQAGFTSNPAWKYRLPISAGLFGLASRYGSDYIPPEYTSYATAMAGPFALPVAAGLITGHASKAGRDPLGAMTSEIGRNIPYPIGLNPISAFYPESLAREFYPNILRDVARAGDPHERSTRNPEPTAEEYINLVTGKGGLEPIIEKLFGAGFEPLKAKIPGAAGRESLPGAGSRLDIYGKPVTGRGTSAFKRFWTSEPMFADPYPEDAPTNELLKQGVVVKPPRYERQVDVAGFKIPLTPEESEGFQQLSRADLRQKLINYINSPRYQNLDESKKPFALKTFFQMMNEIGRMKAQMGTTKRVIPDKKRMEEAKKQIKKEFGR